MTGDADTPGPRLTIWRKALFGVGSAEDGAQIVVVGGLLLLYYSQVLGLPIAAASAVLGATLFVDAVFDLLLAQVSDNLRARLGRRHTLMYASVLPVGLSFVALWTPPPHLDHAQLLIWLAVFVTLFRFSHSLYMVPSGALMPEIAPGYHARTDTLGYRYMLGAIGGAVAAVLAYGVFLRPAAGFPQGQLNPRGYPPMAAAVAVLMMAANLASCVGTHAFIPGLHRPEATRTGLRGWARQVGEIFANRNFLVAVAGSMLAAASAALTAGLAIYFNTFLFRLPASNVMLLVATQALSGPPALLLALAAQRRWGKRRAYLTLFLAGLVFLYGPLLLRVADLTPPTGSRRLLALLLAAQAMSNLLVIAGSIVNTSMIADVVEDNQARTGRRAEGLVLFSDRLMLKLASGLATVLPGLLLVWAGFPGGAHAAPSMPVMRRLVTAYVGLGVLLSGGAFSVWLAFRIDHDAHRRNLAAIGRATGGRQDAID